MERVAGTHRMVFKHLKEEDIILSLANINSLKISSQPMLHYIQIRYSATAIKVMAIKN